MLDMHGDDLETITDPEAYQRMLDDRARYLRQRLPVSTASGSRYKYEQPLMIENSLRPKPSTRKCMRFTGFYKEMTIENKFNYYHDFRNKILLSNRMKIGPEEGC